ncbi:MAG: ribosome small subunit-dependent GTPase A, partial [Thermoanaerobaculia bacterium]|nr:ribosome small subunit-dependent GTPase A [Thermoanaerobaculia bacterium]
EAFADIEELAAGCRFRDCSHQNEPGCEVRAAVGDGTLAAARLESWRQLRDEQKGLEERKAERAQMQAAYRRNLKRRRS